MAARRRAACRTWRWSTIRCRVPEGSPYRPPPKAAAAGYLSGLYDLDELGLQLRKQAGQVGMNRAEVWIGLTDGGNGLEEFVRKNFSREPVLILDPGTRSTT